MKIVAIIPVFNQHLITEKALELLENDEYTSIVMDNGSDEEFKSKVSNVEIVKYDEPLGSYNIFFEALELTDADILAFFHSDFFIFDKEWHKKVISEFERDDKLGLIGFIGAKGVGADGGRIDTMSNWVRRRDCDWEGSSAEEHGKRLIGFEYGATVDGCSMIFRRKTLEEIVEKADFPPMHFYDKLLSCQTLEAGYKVGILGIESSHISGQTVNQERKVHEFFRDWATSRHLHPGGLGTDWNSVIYQEAERRWLSEYRDFKHFIPHMVDANGNLTQ